MSTPSPHSPQESGGFPLAAQLHQATQRWLRPLLLRAIARFWPRMVADGELDDLVVTLEEAEESLGLNQLPPPIDIPPTEELDARLREALDGLEPLLEAPEMRPLLNLGLTSLDLHIVLCAWGLERSPALLRLAAFVWSDFAVKQPTVGFLCELLADDPERLSPYAHRFSPLQPLLRAACLRLGESSDWRTSTPLLQRPLSLADGLAQWLDGAPALDARLPASTLQIDTQPPPRRLWGVPPDHLSLVEHNLTGEGPPIILSGPLGVGRKSLIRTAARSTQRPLRWFSVEALIDLGDPQIRLVDALRDARLAQAAPVFTVRARTLAPTALHQFVRALAHAHERLPGPLLIVCAPQEESAWVEGLGARGIQLAIAAQNDRLRLYAQILSGAGFNVDPTLLTRLVSDYAAPAGTLVQAIREVRLHVGGPDLPPDLLDRALRAAIRSRLGELADLKPPTQLQRADLVLGAEQHRALDEILTHARYKIQVLHEWGFGAQATGQGIACLFSGPPGTGKTLAASILGAELGLDVYQVDLARMVDKYIGETEKNLAQLFDEAQRAPVILLFDEADSLFGSRSKVEKAQDRYANLEINFLLQRMERFSGISILTSNRPNDLDAAFKRRLRFRVHFTLPEVAQRTQLWRQLLPVDCLVDASYNPESLAQSFEVSGATIRSTLLRAAFMAAAAQRPMNQEMIEIALRTELAELGRLASQ